MSEDVVFSQQEHLGVITLNRPQSLNALTLEMVKAIAHQLESWRDDVTIHAVIIRSTEGKAFCAGGDVIGLYNGRRGSPEQMTFFKEEYRLNQLIHHYPKPYVALMDGMTMGGGVGISLHGSHPVASSSFIFAMPETTIGFFPDVGASYLLSKCPGKIGVYLGLTGHRLHADEAYAAGLVKYLVESTGFDDVLGALRQTDLSCDAHARVSACLDRFHKSTHSHAFTELQLKVDSAFAYKDMIALMSTLEKHDDQWSQELIQTLKQKSPLSLCVTLAQLNKADEMSFDECIQMDRCLAYHFMKDSDFYEGVRALLIDKDKSPHWSPNALSLVGPSQIKGYFTEY